MGLRFCVGEVAYPKASNQSVKEDLISALKFHLKGNVHYVFSLDNNLLYKSAIKSYPFIL